MVCRARRTGIRPGRWYQLTELIVVALEKGLATLLLLAGLLTAAGGITATVFLSRGGEVGVVLESKNHPKCVSVLSVVYDTCFCTGDQLEMPTQHYPALCPQGRASWQDRCAPVFLELQNSHSQEAGQLLSSCTPNHRAWGKVVLSLLILLQICISLSGLLWSWGGVM